METNGLSSPYVSDNLAFRFKARTGAFNMSGVTHLAPLLSKAVTDERRGKERQLNMKWYAQNLKSCKLGTMPALVLVHGKDRIEPDNWIRIKECEGDKWHEVFVISVMDDGYFFADR